MTAPNDMVKYGTGDARSGCRRPYAQAEFMGRNASAAGRVPTGV
jgi:hypothetical protein